MSIKIKNNPLKGTLRVTSHQGNRISPISGEYKTHKGTDFGASSGTPIVAVDDGVVIINRYDANGYGNYVVIDHGSYYSLYAHMSTKGIPAGTQVKAGTQVGTVGSTGASTGPHLHFELRTGGSDFWSATIHNPMKYLNSGKNAKAIQNDYEEPHLAPEYDSSTNIKPIAIQNNSPVYPMTVTQSSRQPLLAFVEIYVDQQKLTFIPPEHVISMEYNRVQDGAGDNFVLVLFDSQWEELEYLFSNNFDRIQLRYGFVGGKTSKTYNVQLSDYTVSFNNTGSILTVQGITTGVVSNLNPVTLHTGTKNPTEAVKSICNKMGWVVSDENIHASNDVSMDIDISLIEEYPATYIINHLAPIAVRSSDGESGYVFYLDETTNPPTAHFKPMEYQASTYKTYVYPRGYNSPIIDLQLTVNGVFGGSGLNSVTTELSSSFIDPITKQEHNISKTVDDVRVNAVGEHTHTSATQSRSLVNAAGNSASYMNAFLNYRLRSAEVLPYEGILTIIGDPEFLVGDTIRLIIVTKDGNLHHSSGLYLVMNITDSIDSGIMRTALKIVKREDIESGIEIVHYKNLLE